MAEWHSVYPGYARRHEFHLAWFNLVLLMVVAVLIGALLSAMFLPAREVVHETQPTPDIPVISKPFSVSMTAPAVDNKGEGVATSLRVDVRPGSGKVLADINQLLFFMDTQYSIQTARDVAANFTGVDTHGLDLIYTIETPDNNITLVGGPSAGAALTIATIAALKQTIPKQDVTITGTIAPDGKIGKVGGVLEKAKAAKARGILLFLVPQDEGMDVSIKPIEHCIQRLNVVYCETTYNRTVTSIGDALNLSVKEVSDIEEAARLFGL